MRRQEERAIQLDYAILLECFVCVQLCVCVWPPGAVFGTDSVGWYKAQLAAAAHIFKPKTPRFM